MGGNLRLEADFEFGAGGVVGKGLAKGQAALATGRGAGLEIDGLGASTQATTSNFYLLLS